MMMMMMMILYRKVFVVDVFGGHWSRECLSLSRWTRRQVPVRVMLFSPFCCVLFFSLFQWKCRALLGDKWDTFPAVVLLFRFFVEFVNFRCCCVSLFRMGACDVVWMCGCVVRLCVWSLVRASQSGAEVPGFQCIWGLFNPFFRFDWGSIYRWKMGSEAPFTTLLSRLFLPTFL